MATTKRSKHKNPLPPKPRPNINTKNGIIRKYKASQTKKRTPPISPSLSQSSSICKPSKPNNLKSCINKQQKPLIISSHKPPSIPSTKKKSKKSVPPPPINRIQSRSAIKPPSPIHKSNNKLLTHESSHSTFTVENNKNKKNKNRNTKPPKQNKNKNKNKCKPPPLPNKKRRKHQKAYSVNSIEIINNGIPESPVKPICKPIFEHPTIGEFYSARVHKKKLQQRQLPLKPQNVIIYFILMGKIYKYILNICLQHKLSLLLPKLSIKLTGNDEILQIITCELGRDERSLSSISKKINNKNNNNNNELDIKTYDQFIKDPIFIYKNNTYNSSLSFIQIGYKNDLDSNNNNNNNIPYIVILSCKTQNNNANQSQSGNTHEMISLSDISNKINNKTHKNKNGHFRSKTQNDIPINGLNLQKYNNNNFRYKDIKKCVENLGYNSFISLGLNIAKEELINYIHTFINYKKKEENEKLYNCLHINTKPKRKRSRSCSGLKDKNKNKTKNNKNNKLKKRHSLKLNNNKRYNNSVSDINNNNMIRLDLSHTNPTKLEFNSPNNSPNNNNKMESKFSRLFRKSFSKKKIGIQSPKTPIILNDNNIFENEEIKKKKKEKINRDIIIIKPKTKIKPRKYREKKEVNIIRKPPPPPPPLLSSSSSKVSITRRTNKHQNSNIIRAAIIVEGYLSTNIGNETNKKWKKYYYTFNKDRLLCSYLTKDCDLSLPIDKLCLVHGKCSFNVNSNSIIITIQTSKKTVVKHFRGTIVSLEKWKRAFLF